ncbi:hypothetical protein [Lysobacter sp. CA199]|uniref:hypothetical protein n=1 Tax=Lysobacter sp. CA199 TaxID=3455608 RepID=UPI003F8D529A
MEPTKPLLLHPFIYPSGRLSLGQGVFVAGSFRIAVRARHPKKTPPPASRTKSLAANIIGSLGGPESRPQVRVPHGGGRRGIGSAPDSSGVADRGYRNPQLLFGYCIQGANSLVKVGCDRASIEGRDSPAAIANGAKNQDILIVRDSVQDAPVEYPPPRRFLPSGDHST